MPRILVIEPEAPSRHALRNILEGAGYEVELASDGAKALDAHAARPVDLVIADIADVDPDHRFPGTRLLATRGGLAGRRDEPVTALHTLSKPFHREDLLAAVRATLGMPAQPGAW